MCEGMVSYTGDQQRQQEASIAVGTRLSCRCDNGAKGTSTRLIVL